MASTLNQNYDHGSPLQQKEIGYRVINSLVLKRCVPANKFMGSLKFLPFGPHFGSKKIYF
jgi:hypothetical protein